MRKAMIWKEIPGGRCISLFLKEKTVSVAPLVAALPPMKNGNS